MEYFVPSTDKKKTNINKKKLNFIKFKKGQSPFEVNAIVKGYQAFFKLPYCKIQTPKGKFERMANKNNQIYKQLLALVTLNLRTQ